MGQKVHPTGIRLRITKNHSSVWYASPKAYKSLLLADVQARQFLMQKLKQAAVSEVLIQRPADNAHIVIRCARPGIAIGRKGEDVEKLREEMATRMGVPVHISIEEVRKPELEAKLVGESIASQLEKRVMFRRAMKRAVQSAMKAGAKGIKVQVSGRLGGADIARSEWYREGRVPLHTLRADVDYGVARAETTYGTIGIKVWIFKGELLEKLAAPTKVSSQSQDERH